MERLRLNIQKFGVTSGECRATINDEGRNTSFYCRWSQTSQSTATNKTTISYTYGITCGWDYYDNALRINYVNINGSQVKGSETYSYLNKGDHDLGSGTMEIEHAADGTKTFNINLSGWVIGAGTTTNSVNFTLNNIPRYTSVTGWSVTSRTETSITLSWKTADTCSQIRYGTSTSSYTTANVNGNSGTVTISGLTAGQTYTLYFMPKRKDSNLWGDGSDNTWKSLANQSTYRYPYCSSTSKNFIIGQPVTISIYNPLKRDVKIQMWSHTSQGFVSDLIDVNTGNKDSYTGFDDVATRLYQSIPNAKSSAYNIDVWTGSHKEVNTVGNYSVDETENKPSFNDFTYADINSTTTALTGDDQKVIQGYSNIQATISVANKAAAQHYATMDRYDLIIQGNATQSASYSDNEDVTIVVNNANSGSIKVNAVDSRNIPKEVPKTATVIPYTNIQRGNISVTRAGNVGEATTLAFEGTMWSGDFGAVTNTITSVQYRYKSTAAGSSWSAYASLTPPTPSGNSYSFSGLIAGDEGNTGFSVDNSFNIEVIVSDRLSSITFTATLGTGIPHVAFGNNGIAIKQPYDDNDSSVLQVNGKTHLKNDLSVTGKITATGNIEASGKLKGNSFTRNTTDTWVPVLNQGYLDYAPRKIYSSKTHTNHGTDNDGFATMSVLSFWNGAYNSSNSSNLTYAHQGTIQCKPTSLYSNDSGTNGTVTLSQTCANFTFLDITFRTNDGNQYMKTERINMYNTTSGIYELYYQFNTGSGVWAKQKMIKINGTSITNGGSASWTVYGSINPDYSYNQIYITRVVGWK